MLDRIAISAADLPFSCNSSLWQIASEFARCAKCSKTEYPPLDSHGSLVCSVCGTYLESPLGLFLLPRLFPLLIYVGSPLKSLSASLPTSKYLPSVGDIITIKLSLAATRKQQSF